MTMLKKARFKIIPIIVAAVTAFTSMGVPAHAETVSASDRSMVEVQSDEGEAAGEQSVILDENRKIISLSQIVKGLKVTVSAHPGVIPDGTQLRVSPIEGVESLALISIQR